ncbi:MAG: T9SS type A sorting domain-containing protein [candidate division KSB1 bacterium]|nr:T9SS type A sorting domain-containing protein [candidate division KSB1 bacterium]MDZ7301180.1 T9SS type A sorting domain-containing protein [candidate division KSB1 bacterium]MDZ7310596.1 T9SS type A sorting domain-containing protein [candidate division KSB1 bacterium]
MISIAKRLEKVIAAEFVILLLLVSLNSLAAQDLEKSEMLQLTKTPVSMQLPPALMKSSVSPLRQVSAPRGGLVTIMSEDFEGTFPSGSWSFNSGNYTWAKRNCSAHAGSYSAWAIGGGTTGSALSCGANYPNSLSTIMIYGPFDLSDANWAAFSFFVSLNSESNADYFSFLASEDGTNFSGYSLSGSTSGGWIPFTQALTAVPTSAGVFKNLTGKPKVWMAFAFSSNATVNFANGAFVDDIVLQKGMVNVPTVVSSFSSPGPSPRGLAYDGANLWCSDATNDRIYKLTTTGSVVSSFASPSTVSTGLAWDGTNLWNSDANTDRIYKLSTTGSILTSFAAPSTGGAGLCWDGANLWHSDADAATIWKLNTSGGTLSSFSAPGTFHYGLAYDGQNLYLADAEALLIYKIDTAGNVLDYYLVPATNPTGLLWDGNYLWTADRDTDLIYKMQISAPQQFANDVGVTNMDLPGVVKVGDAVPINVVVKNFGTAVQSNFPVKYSINNGPEVTENFTGTLAAGASTTKTFSTPWTPTAEGTYRFTAWTALTGDENSANDALPAPKEVVVESRNTAPTLAGIGNQTVTAGQIKNLPLSATDPDGDALTFSIPTNPGFLSISGFSQGGNTATATLIIAPTASLTGTFNATVQVADDKGGVDSENFTIQVRAPQINPLDAYRVEPFVKRMEPLTGTTTQIFGPNTSWQLSPAIDLPFTFTYLGKAYNQIKVSSNGFITFNVSETYHYLTNDLHAVSPKNTLAPLWDYLNIGSSGKVHYQTVGNAPNRKFVVEFYHVVWGPFSSPVVDFQIQLLEGSNDIEFHYGTMANAGFGADGASIGIKDDQGNFINALDGSRDLAQNKIVKPPKTNFRFTTSPAPQKEVGVAGIMVPSIWFVGDPDTVKVIVENHGSQEQAGFTVAYQIDGKSPVREVFAATILPGSKALMTFSTPWEPQLGGLYSVQAWTELSGDAITLNDSLLVDDAIKVYDLERPAPINVQGTMNEQYRPVIHWSRGNFQKPLPGEWNGKTSEDLNVHMVLNYNSTNVDTCEIYFKVYGNPFSFPLETYDKVSIKNNQFSFYYSDQYGRMSTDVKGTFFPPDSCAGTWRAGVVVNGVYTVFSGTWYATAEFPTPQLLGFKIYRTVNAGVQPVPANLLTEISDPLATSFVDNQVTGGMRYYYVVTASYDRGQSPASNEVSVMVTSVADNTSSMPMVYCLYPAFPNPFNPQTTIHYDLPKSSNVELKVYNALGELVTTLVNQWQPAGRHEVVFRAEGISSGVYFISFEAGDDYRSIKRVTLLK